MKDQEDRGKGDGRGQGGSESPPHFFTQRIFIEGLSVPGMVLGGQGENEQSRQGARSPGACGLVGADRVLRLVLRRKVQGALWCEAEGSGREGGTESLSPGGPGG